MKKILRRLLFIPNPKITAKRALEIARMEYENRGGIQWNPEIIEGLKKWTVVARKDIKGAARIEIDQQCGKIINYAELPL